MTNEYVWNWIKYMKKCPPNSYPLDKYFNPHSNKWVDLYLINGNNERLSVNPEFCVNYEYIAQQWKNKPNPNDFTTKWHKNVEMQKNLTILKQL